ncbi:hypothetical protein C6503_17460 [Candidatus Poribacteria bacterium]|nr:MAG: hypothetical protein C6503_17460 [Candidatus Poribacteria bacterium]
MQNPQGGGELARLNQCLLVDTYPHELASSSEQQPLAPLKGIEVDRENPKKIKIARENYRISNADQPKPQVLMSTD